MLLDDELDVVFTILYDVVQTKKEKIEYRILGESPHMVCMLKTNPLAQKDKIYVCDLAPYDFIGISPLKTQSYISMLTELCYEYGFLPNFSCFTTSANSLALNLISDKDIFICDKFFRDFGSTHICAKPIEDNNSGFVIAWKKENNNKIREVFVKETLEFFD